MSAEELEVVVLGEPQQQGSKNPWGGDANKNLMPWRAVCKAMVDEAMKDQGFEYVLSGPVYVICTFRFSRPRSHYRTGKNAHLLRPSSPHYKTSKPDTDKLQRAVGDALTGVAIKDDSQIVKWGTVKVYGDSPRTELLIGRLDDEGSIPETFR